VRLAVLDRLRARLQGLPSEAEPMPRYDPESRLLYPALDLGTAGDEYQQSELAYLPTSCAPAAFLDKWERELGSLTGDRSTAGRGWDFLVRYCRCIDLNPALSARFLERY